MRLGVDASNTRGGGGLTHFAQMLPTADPRAHGFDAVVLWASQATLARLKDRALLLKRYETALAKLNEKELTFHILCSSGRILQRDTLGRLRAYGWSGCTAINLCRQNKGCYAPKIPRSSARSIVVRILPRMQKFRWRIASRNTVAPAQTP
jgi:hypothetical protein